MLILTQLWSNRFIRYTAIILVVVAVVFLVGKSVGKKKEEKKQVKLPNNGKGIPEKWDPKPLANEVYRNFKGVFTWAAQKEVTMGKLFSLTDDQLVAVYNAFNKHYGGGKTLTYWLEDEFNVTLGGVRNSLVERLVKLNCL
jgi:hypothetical protein